MHAEYPYNQLCLRLKCLSLLGSLVWASDLIPLDYLYLRPLQLHFHSLGLTNRFTPPHRSDPLVLANLLRQWQDLSFLTSGIPIRPFQAEFMIFTQSWGAQMGFPRFRVLDPFRPQGPHQHFGAQGDNFGPPSLGFSFTGQPTCDRYREQYSCSLYQQTGWDPFPLFPYSVTSRSGSVPIARNSGHSHSGQTHFGLSKHDSGPPILAEPAQNNRVESSPRNSNLDLQGISTVDMFATVHNMHLPQFVSLISELRALAIDALSQAWQGRSMFMFPPFPLLSKVIQKFRTTQEG